MIDELLKQFPILLKALLEKLSQSEFSVSGKEAQEAKNKLLSQLQSLTDEISKLQNVSGEKLSEEQIKKLVDLRGGMPNMNWLIKPRGS